MNYALLMWNEFNLPFTTILENIIHIYIFMIFKFYINKSHSHFLFLCQFSINKEKNMYIVSLIFLQKRIMEILILVTTLPLLVL